MKDKGNQLCTPCGNFIAIVCTSWMELDRVPVYLGVGWFGYGWYGVRLRIYQAQSDLESPMVARQVIDAIPTGNLSGHLLQTKKLVIT